MGKFSRDKGARGERLLCSALRDNGYDVHRTAQRAGKLGNAPDVDGLPGIYAECKFVERLNIRDAIEQAKRDAAASGNGDLPAVFHKKSNESWLVTMELDDWIRVYREWEAGRAKKKTCGSCEWLEKDEGKPYYCAWHDLYDYHKENDAACEDWSWRL